MSKALNKGGVSTAIQIIAYVVMVVYTVLTIGPLVWLFYSSLKPHGDIMRNPMALPTGLDFSNFVHTWKGGNLGQGMINSIMYTVISLSVSTILAMMASFGFAKFPYKKVTGILYYLVLLGILLSMEALLIPLFIMSTQTGLYDTRIGLIIPYIAFGLPMAIFLGTTYLKGVPDELVESAIIDGSGYLRIFWSIILPVATPVVTTIVIFGFIGIWNDFVLAFMLASKESIRTLQIGINSFAGSLTNNYGWQFAALVVGTVPMLVFYAIFYQKIVEGYAGGALKG